MLGSNNCGVVELRGLPRREPLDRGRHLVPTPAVDSASFGLRCTATPLLEEERDAGVLTHVADPPPPFPLDFPLDRTMIRARLPAGDHPVNSFKVEPVERSYQRL